MDEETYMGFGDDEYSLRLKFLDAPSNVDVLEIYHYNVRKAPISHYRYRCVPGAYKDIEDQ